MVRSTSQTASSERSMQYVSHRMDCQRYVNLWFDCHGWMDWMARGTRPHNRTKPTFYPRLA